MERGGYGHVSVFARNKTLGIYKNIEIFFRGEKDKRNLIKKK